MLQVRPARTVDLPGLAIVLHDAFSAKLRRLFGQDPDTVRAILEATYAGPVKRGYDGVLVAERAGRVVGTLVIEPVYRTVPENRAFERFIIGRLGLPRVLWAAFLLWLLGHDAQEGEAHITDVAVAPDVQGEGIGAQLMDAAEQWARDHDRERLTLWVAANNPAAIRLYEKTGYHIVRTHSSWLLRLAFGIKDWHFMQRNLDTPPLALPAPDSASHSERR